MTERPTVFMFMRGASGLVSLARGTLGDPWKQRGVQRQLGGKLSGQQDLDSGGL